MNRNKKKILATALAVCMLGILSFGTLAWFNASESVTNKFMVASTGTGAGGSTPAEKTFSVDVWEKVDSDGDGDVDDDDTKVSYRDNVLTGWNYDNILPGVTYHKEPIVENTGSYDQYIRVVVTLSNATKWATVLPAGYNLGEIFIDHEESVWKRDTAIKLQDGTTVEAIVNTTEDTISYVYYMEGSLAPASTATVFTGVKLPEELTQDDIAKLAVVDGAGDVTIDFSITVCADALQTTFDADSGVTDAKSAFDYVNWSAEQREP